MIDVSGVSTADGAAIWQWDWLAGANQQWQIIPQSGSYNAIMNLNSQKMLDDTGYSLNNGSYIQQYTWLGGLNQQWEVIPIQNTYQSTAQTNIYYYASNHVAQVAATSDSDYSTQYYYAGNQFYTAVTRNGVNVINGEWGHNAGEVGFGSVYLSLTANPGDYVQAITTYAMVVKYTEQQVNPGGCGVTFSCLDWFDAYYYGFMEGNTEGIDIPVFTTTVWAAPIVIAAAHAAQTIILGQNGSSYHVPGGGTVFDIKYRDFIPAAWIDGVPGADDCITSNGTTRHVIYAGDNRGFDPFSTSFRTYSNVTVSSSTATALWTYFAAGKTIRYADDAIAPDGYTLYSDSVLHDCHYTDNVVYEQTYDMHSSTGGGGGTVNTHIWGSGTNLASNAQSWTPAIDWDFLVSINTASNPAIPAYSVTYQHDCYPAHELFIGTQLVYGYKPTSNSWVTVGSCLSGFTPVSGTTVGTVN